MKRILCILTACCVLLLSGCVNGAAAPAGSEAVTVKPSSSGAGAASSTGAVSSEASEGAIWPTKGWSTSAPEEQGIDPALLEKADARIGENYPNIYSLLVVRHGMLVYEKYYQGMNEDSANPVYSVTKSVLSALTGIAIREKLIENVDQKVSEFMPELFNGVDNPQKNDITIQNVLTMSGGLKTIDDDYASYFTSQSWLSYALQKPLTDKPGEKFVYNTGLTHFLSGIITETSAMSTRDFAEKFLFSQIGITAGQWDQDMSGYYCGGSGLYLTPRDMAKLGYLYLNKGRWDGKQIIPEEWVAASTQKQITVNEGVDYGYLFWIQPMQDAAHNKTYATFRADGAGGQKVVVIPELDTVVVITANLFSASLDKADTQALIPDYILPAIT